MLTPEEEKMLNDLLDKLHNLYTTFEFGIEARVIRQQTIKHTEGILNLNKLIKNSQKLTQQYADALNKSSVNKL